MRMIKMALLGGAAVAVTAASAQADDLDALKAQIEALNARIAAMETAPAVPTGYQLIAVSEGERVNTPGLEMSARERAAYGDRATVISVLPTADAPAGSTITWSGYARAGLVYQDNGTDTKVKKTEWDDNNTPTNSADDTFDLVTNTSVENNDDSIDVKARGQIRVTASTDTAVGEVGVDLRVRANFNGNGNGDVYMDVAWGYWAMTPELTFGGGYSGSLGNIGYGYDGACTCYYTDNADLAFNPGDTTQMRLSYASGPLSFAVALEDASLDAGGDNLDADGKLNNNELGAAGEIKYSGDSFSGEIAGVWRGINDEAYASFKDGDDVLTLTTDNIESLWQIGAGVNFALGDIASLSLAAATGEGPYTQTTEGEITGVVPINNNWWGVSALASFKLTDEIHAEIAGGYKKREGDDVEFAGSITDANGDKRNVEGKLTDIEYDTYGFQGGLYYSPVDQLTIGVEAEWSIKNISYDQYTDENLNDNRWDSIENVDASPDQLTVDLVSVWRF